MLVEELLLFFLSRLTFRVTVRTAAHGIAVRVSRMSHEVCNIQRGLQTEDRRNSRKLAESFLL